MEIVVALFELVAMTILLAAGICGLCFMGLIVYFGIKSRRDFDKEFEGDEDD